MIDSQNDKRVQFVFILDRMVFILGDALRKIAGTNSKDITAKITNVINLPVSPQASQDQPKITHNSNGESKGILKAFQTGTSKARIALAVTGTYVVVIEGPKSSL